MTNTILMSLEHLIVDQEQSHVLKMSTNNLRHWRIAKGNLVVNHQKWIDTIMKNNAIN